MSKIPELSGDALAARDSDAKHIQIIASAGSGKTETISQRVARLIRDGADPAKIVAFTFTIKAAEELKERIRARVEEFASKEAADKLGGLYVGTIHGYCLQLLQANVGIYESYDMIDENQLAAFAIRWKTELNLNQFDLERPEKPRLYAGMKFFLENVQVVENELLSKELLEEEFAKSMARLYELLDQHRMMTFGMQIDRAVIELEKPDVRQLLKSKIEHLIVDEYQDVNPAQERLIQLLSDPIGAANLVVVGDDDQAIYQWRGSTVENITTFASRYPDVKTFELLTNRRSRPAIVKLASNFANSIPNRISKSMDPSREHNGPAIDIIENHETEADEAADIAASIKKLAAKGYSYSQIAILVRTRTSYPAILEALELEGIPVTPGDRVGLFDQPDADWFARVFAWLADTDWKDTIYGEKVEPVTLEDLKTRFKALYTTQWSDVALLLREQKALVGSDSRKYSLVEFCYKLMDKLGVKDWDAQFVLYTSRLGTLAKFAKFVGDYEAMAKHSRQNEDGSQTGASDQAEWYLLSITALMAHYARDKYRDFAGDGEHSGDSVDLMTVHTAKGLEWPIVFVPSLTARRFPSSRSGKRKPWIVSRELFDAERYEGTDGDERRLFYVAVTRAREWVSLSAHEKVTTKGGKVSPYIIEALALYQDPKDFPADWAEGDSTIDQDETMQITYSEIADFLSCGWGYWLKSRIGFPSIIVETIGYGKAVHHLMRSIAEETAKRGRQLSPMDVDRLIATEFFLPFANSAIALGYKESARKLAFSYLKDHAEEMSRVWETERPFELAVPGALISGRADVILDLHEGKPDNLAIIDYKTGTEGQEFDLQLQIYSEAGKREGLEVRGAFVHDLKENKRIVIDTSDGAREQAIGRVSEAVQLIKKREFEAKPEVSKCGRCDVRAICRASKAKK